jgi:ATP/maltotriose-dependent transcriptional regulator MalT
LVTLALSSTRMNSNMGQNNPSSVSILEDMQIVTKLLSFGQSLCDQTHNAVDQLCRELKILAQGKAALCLSHQGALKGRSSSSTPFHTLPIQFRNRTYGTLSVFSDSTNRKRPALSLPVAQLLAQTCGWLLYTLEQSAFLQGQCRELDYQVHGPLTKREREVLRLMCQGYNQEAIAKILCISPATVGKHRQHIYDTLGVHRERDALLVAYRVGLFSLGREPNP